MQASRKSQLARANCELCEERKREGQGTSEAACEVDADRATVLAEVDVRHQCGCLRLLLGLVMCEGSGPEAAFLSDLP